MKKTILIAALALIAASCAKETPVVNDMENTGIMIAKSFTVDAPDTKTVLDGMAVKWAAGDEINVIAATSGNQYTFTIKPGTEGSASATFTGEIDSVDESETTFYSVYPNVQIKKESLANDLIDFKDVLGAVQTAVKNGFDPHFAPLTAISTDGGSFSFRHGAAYFKIRIGNENVKSVNIKTSNARFQGRPQYVASTGAYSNIQNAADNITLKAAAGDLEKDAVYYVPVLCKNSSLKTLTVTYSFSDGTSDKFISTDKKSSVKLELGKLYDLGTPTMSLAPEINAADVSLEADATSGSITYSVANPVSGGVMTAALKEASDWLTVGAVSDGSVALTSTANTSDARNAVVVLTYTYNTDQTVTKEVVVSQKSGSGGSAESHVRILYNGSTELLDGEASSTYFSHSTSYVNLSSSVNNGGGIDSFDIPGTSLTSTKTVKLDGSGFLKFTTSSSLKSEVTFYYVMRKSGSGKIQITPTGGSATVYDDVVYATVNSKTVSLEKSTEYTIARNSGEQLLVAVVVNETE